MTVLLHFHFSLPAEALKSEGAESAELLRRGLQPLLAWLEFVPELKASASFSGLFLEALSDSTLSAIRALTEKGQLEILLTPFYDPCLPLLLPEEQAEHLELARAYWAAKKISHGSGLFIEHGIAAHALPQYNAAGTTYLFAPERCFREGMAALTSFTGGTNPMVLLPTVVCELKLGEYAPGMKPIAKSSAPNGGPPHALTFRVTPESLFAERLNPFEMRNGYLELFKHFKGDAARVLETGKTLVGPLPGGAVLQLSKLCPNVDALSEVIAPTPGAGNRGREQLAFAARMNELREGLSRLPELIRSMPNEFTNLERLREARKHYCRAQNAGFTLASAEGFLAHRLRRAWADSIVCAQVELDAIAHPEVDPLHGWITHELVDQNSDGTPEVVADSQLKRLYFQPSLAGALVGFDYKPRKVNLSNTVDPLGRNLSFIDGVIELSAADLSAASVPAIATLLIPAQGETAEPLVTRQTLDLFGLRLIRTLVPRSFKAPGKSSLNIVKHFTVKAGIGAYLNNATTGLSVESWVEGQSAAQPNQYLVSQYCFSLPSGNADGMSIRPLSVAGGASDTALNLTELRYLENKDVTGGLYGTRLIDGINGFVMDLRSAKPLNAMAVYPLIVSESLPAEDRCGGIAVLFFISLSRVFNDDKANTVFLSIM